LGIVLADNICNDVLKTSMKLLLVEIEEIHGESVYRDDTEQSS